MSIRQIRHFLSGLVVIVFMVLAFGSEDSDTASIENNTETIETEIINIGETGVTDYFEILVNKVVVSDRVNTGNQFADLNREPGNQYLAFKITFKNIDNESRMFTDGDVLINYNGKEYRYDKSETILLEGWGTMLDQINPLTSKTTNLVYKIPQEITGDLYWRPGRNSKNVTFYLGNIQAEASTGE